MFHGEVHMRSLFNRKGQSIVEIALITPLILIVLYVPFDFGMAIIAGHITQNAVRDGARIASTTDSMDSSKADTLATQVYNNLPPSLISGSTTKRVTVNFYSAANCAQNVEVIAQGSYNFFFYRLMALLQMSSPTETPITRTTKMWYDKQPDLNGGTTGSATFCGGTAAATGTHP
jgi:Flp pilus assembly protein TadG